MIELEVESIRISLLSSRRVVVLKDLTAERYLPIWIGAAEADAITIKLQDMQVSRPMTHDLLKNVIEALGATISHVTITQLVDNLEGSGTFHASIFLTMGDQEIEVDSRSSDAIALAVRVGAPIFADDQVLERAAIVPSPDIETPTSGQSDEDLTIFRDFIDGLEE
jgi:bifunctional DNase/RNase